MTDHQEGDPTTPNIEPQQRALEKLTELRESLGFVETDELVALRRQIVEAARAGNVEARKQYYDQYQVEAVALVDDATPSVRIGYHVALADMRLGAGSVDGCLDELEDILQDMRQQPGFEAHAAELDMIMRPLEGR